MHRHLHRILRHAARFIPLGLAIGTACGWALILLAPALSQAQIVANPQAPGNQRPIVLQTGNGAPLVQIMTPSAAGVSRNRFSQFDVQGNGVVLNNVRANAAPTQLGGYVQANPFLATGAARVILNEVDSSNPSSPPATSRTMPPTAPAAPAWVSARAWWGRTWA